MLQIYLAKMVSYQIYHANDSGIKGESIGNYSYTRESAGGGDAGYPAEILRGLNKWKYIKCKFGSFVPHLRDRRGLSIDLQTTDSSL